MPGSEFTLGPIVPTRELATIILETTNADLKHANADPDYITAEADPQSEKCIDTQIGKLSQTPNAYIGLYDRGELGGFAKLIEWRTGDQAYFESLLGSLALRGMAKVTHGHLPSRPVGIQSLAVHPDYNGDAQADALDALTRAVVARGGQHDMRIPVYDGDPATDILKQHGFFDSGKRGMTATVRNALYYRKPLR